MIVTDHGQSAHRDVEPEGLGDVVSLVVEVRLVNNLGDPPQNRIGQLVPVQHRFERAVSGVVAELRPAHVEPSRLRSSVPNQKRTELGLRVEEPPDQPCARGPVDVDARPR